MSTIMFALAQTTPTDETKIFGMSPFEFILAATAVLGTLLQLVSWITSTIQTSHSNRHYSDQTKLMAGGTMSDLPDRKFLVPSRLPFTFGLIVSLLMWSAVLYNFWHRRESIFLLAIVLLLAILSLIWPMVRRSGAVRGGIADPAVRIASPFATDPILTNKVRVKGTCAFHPSGDWMLWTKIGQIYWPQKKLDFSANGKNWTSSVDINSTEETTIFVAEVNPEIRRLVGSYYDHAQETKKWIGMPRPDEMRVVDEVTVQRPATHIKTLEEKLAAIASTTERLVAIDQRKDRKITHAEMVLMKPHLIAFSSQTFRVVQIGRTDTEARGFAMQIGEMLHMAKWSWNGSASCFDDPDNKIEVRRGISYAIGRESQNNDKTTNAEVALQALQTAMFSVGILNSLIADKHEPCMQSSWPLPVGMIEIVVSHKP